MSMTIANIKSRLTGVGRDAQPARTPSLRRAEQRNAFRRMKSTRHGELYLVAPCDCSQHARPSGGKLTMQAMIARRVCLRCGARLRGGGGVDVRFPYGGMRFAVPPYALSRTEMKETEGAWVANAIGGVIGFITGNFIYLIESSFNSNATFSFTDYAQTVGTSTVLGAFDPGNSVANAGRAVVTAGVGAWNMRP